MKDSKIAMADQVAILSMLLQNRLFLPAKEYILFACQHINKQVVI